MNIKKKILAFNNKYPNSSFWIGGKHSVILAIHNPKRKIYKIVLHEKMKNTNDKIITKHVDKIFFENDKFFSNIFKSEIPHQGYAVLVDKIDHGKFKDFIDKKLKINKNCNIIALDGVNDPRNIGSIVRSASAFSFDAIIINKKDFNSKSFLLYKSASGAMENIPIFEVSNILNEINVLKERNFYIAGMDMRSQKSIFNFSITKKNLIIFGSEEYGLKNLIKSNCDSTYKIPINENIESLNVSNACAATFAILNFLQK